MKKIYKVLLFIIFLFLFTGCTVDYNITFKSDNTLDENIQISESTELLKESGYTIDEIVESKIDSYSDEISNNSFSIKRVNNDTNTSVILSSSNKSVSKFIEFPYFTKMFNGADIDEKNNIYSFETNGIYNQSGLFYDLSGTVDEGFIDQININIKFEDSVISTNADSYDESTDTYTWTINSETEDKSIKFELLKTNEEKNSKETFNFMYILIGIGVIVGIIIIVLLYAMGLNKKRNEL